MKNFFISLGYLVLACSSSTLICADLLKKTKELASQVRGSGSPATPSAPAPAQPLLPSAPDAVPSAGFLDNAYAMADNAWGKITYPFKATWNAGNNAVQWVQENPKTTALYAGAAAITGWYLYKKFRNFFTPIQSVAGIVHDSRQVNWYQITLVNVQNPVAHVTFAQSNDLNDLYTQVTRWALQECQGRQGPQQFKVIVYVDIKGLVGRRSLGERILSVHPPVQPGANANFDEFFNFFTLNVAASHQNLQTMPVAFQNSIVKASASLKNIDASFTRETHLSDSTCDELNDKVVTFFANNLQPDVTKRFELRFSYKDNVGDLFHIQPFVITLDGTALLTHVGYDPAFGFPVADPHNPNPDPTYWQQVKKAWFYSFQERRDHKGHLRQCQEAAAQHAWQHQCQAHLQ